MQQNVQIYTMIVYRTERRACIIVIQDPVVLANNHTVFLSTFHTIRYMAEILLIRRKTPNNQS